MDGLIMKSLVRSRKILTVAIAFAILLLAWWGWDYSASGRGYIVARFDVARGHYRVLHYGLPPPGLHKYARILRERYGIEYLEVAGCVVSPSLMAYADGYNAVSMAGARRKYGRDIFQEP
jgi:hypothetical protein